MKPLPTYLQNQITKWKRSTGGELYHGSTFVDEVYLSATELLVAKLISSNLAPKEVGSQLNRSHKTIDKHVSSLYRKLRARGYQINNFVALTHWVLKNKLIQIADCI